MIEIIAIAICLLMLSCIGFFEQIFIIIPMIVIGALCIALVIVMASVIVCHYVNTIGLNIGN